MKDAYDAHAEVDQAIFEHHADRLEARFEDPRQQAMLRDYLSDLTFPDGASVLDIGCGTGAVTRRLAAWPGVAKATGVDPINAFLSRARELARGAENIVFEQGDARALSFDDETFDVVVSHTVITHVSQPEKLVAEAFRVLRPGGWIALFDGDYATSTVATRSCDPLQACVDVLPVHDMYLVRRFPTLLAEGGFDDVRVRSHGYVEDPKGGYMASWIERGAKALADVGAIGTELAEALSAEARRRCEAGRWVGQMTFLSAIGRKPAR
ncbi:MAG TPA: methyltransferase domain-containing protein [Allosphingosinicella sp.]|jgi:ubiquinone/menaquinone biosynthesis C-methylase UbiE|nr:methyltransferase domain-containing protein [Allosphingosinicella sp.]